MPSDLHAARDLAIRVAAEAGELASAQFGGIVVSRVKDPRGDLVTEVDLAAERFVVDSILKAFPHHHVVAEETGSHGPAGEWVWYADALDGTNNFVLDLPIYGVCLTLCHDGDPVLAVVHDSHLRRTCWAVRGEGAFEESDRLWLKDPGPPHLLTVSWIQGYEVSPSDETAREIRRALESQFKRVLQTWAPSIDWSLLVRGKVAAVVAFSEESEDLLCGVVLSREAGGVVVDLAGQEPSRPFSNGLIAGSPAATQAVLRSLGGIVS
jgi:myo-inositol-1(or 4)-monophosphatase